MLQHFQRVCLLGGCLDVKKTFRCIFYKPKLL